MQLREPWNRIAAEYYLKEGLRVLSQSLVKRLLQHDCRAASRRLNRRKKKIIIIIMMAKPRTYRNHASQRTIFTVFICPRGIFTRVFTTATNDEEKEPPVFSSIFSSIFLSRPREYDRRITGSHSSLLQRTERARIFSLATFKGARQQRAKCIAPTRVNFLPTTDASTTS